ncbi:MAG: lysine-sensitive aspartokinase 3 [Chlorobiota bacterium]
MNFDNLKVLKFGGTSVKDATAIKQVSKIVNSTNTKQVVVVSAHAGVTNLLVDICNGQKQEIVQLIESFLSIHKQIAQDLGVLEKVESFINEEVEEIRILTNYLPLSAQLKDVIMTKGELLSSTIIFEYLLKINDSVSFVDSRKVIKTDSNFNNANIDLDATTNEVNTTLVKTLNDSNIIIMGGFISSDKQDRPTTLGRGGSDYTAAIVASILDAKELEIWTDVSGILTSDPRVIDNVKKVKKLSYSEASELSFFGAKVLHPSTIHPAVKNGIPVRVKNTFNPDDEGTVVISEKSNIEMIKAIAFRKDVVTITISSNRMLGAVGFMSKVFQVFEELQIPVDIVTTSEVSISVTINKAEYDSNLKDRLSLLGEVVVTVDNAIIAAIGEGIKQTAGIASRLFGALKGININMVSVGASEVNLSIVVKEYDLVQAVSLLHDEFFKNELNSEFFEEI